MTSLNELAMFCHQASRKFWYTEDGTRIERNKGELMMLMVTEIAEAFEGERKHLMDDKLPHRPAVEVELFDCLCRILDYAGAFGYDLDGAMVEKMAYNESREDHKIEAARRAAGEPI
jgi:hypothetical protein